MIFRHGVCEAVAHIELSPMTAAFAVPEKMRLVQLIFKRQLDGVGLTKPFAQRQFSGKAIYFSFLMLSGIAGSSV